MRVAVSALGAPLRNLGARVRRVSPWSWLLLAGIGLYTWYFTRLSLDVHHGLGTSSYDLGLYDQGVWLMSRFEAPFVTLMGRNLMGDHTSFILVLLVPLYWVFPAVGTLLFVQSAVIAAGAIPVYLAARRRLGSGWVALALGLAYLLHPAVVGTNIENFHPDSFLGLLVGMAIYAALERRWRLYAVFVVLALLVKEDVALVLVPLGVWVGLRRDRRIGVLTVLGSVAFTLVAMFVVMRGLTGIATRNTWRIPFGGPTGLIKRTVSHPDDVAAHLLGDSRPFYLWQMTAPFAYVFARRPDVAAIGALVLFTNVLSSFSYQFDVHYHYSLIAVPPLAIGTVHGLAAISGHARRVLAVAVLVCALWASHLWGWMPWSRYEVAHWAADHPVAEAMREIIEEIPSDAVVSAYHSAAPHLSHRREIYQFPNPFRISLYGHDVALENTRDENRAERVEYVLLPRSLGDEGQADFAVIAPAFEEVAVTDGWMLYRRDPDIELPPLAPPDA